MAAVVVSGRCWRATAAAAGLGLVCRSGQRATRTAIGARLSEYWDVVLWSGHGAPGRLMAADGPVSAEWLACMMRQAPPGVVLLSACYSGARDDSLHSLAESLSQSSITCVGMWVTVTDRAAVIYDVEFLRADVSGRRVACGFVAWRTGSRATSSLSAGGDGGAGDRP